MFYSTACPSPLPLINQFPHLLSSHICSLIIKDLIKSAMISVLTQERLLGAALGSILTGVVIFEQRKTIYESISKTQSQPHEPIFGRRFRQELAHTWNKAVDRTMGPVIQSLSSRGW